MISQFRFVFFMIIAAIVLPLITMNCARESRPTGGLKDTIAPIVEWEKPRNNSVSITPKRITIAWNEKINVEKISENCIISPPLSKMPDISVSGKKLYIDLKNEKLQENTTYNFLFTNAIKDVNEANVVESYSYAFSNNQQIDSLKVAGTVKYAQNLEIPKAAYVVMYNAINRDAFKKEKPKYITQIKKDGTFEITHIAKGSYIIFALEDLNKDFIWNQVTEKIAMYDSVITPFASSRVDTITIAAKDSLSKDSTIIKLRTKWSHQDINLLLFQNSNADFSINNSKRNSKYSCSLKTTVPCNVSDLDFAFNGFTKASYQTEQYSEDSIIIWLRDTALINKSEVTCIVTHVPSKVVDTLQIFSTKNLPDNILANNKNASSIVFPKDSIILLFNRPLQELQTQLITVNELKDTAGLFNSYKQPYVVDQNKNVSQLIQIAPSVTEFVNKFYYDSQQIISYKTGLNRFALYLSKSSSPQDLKITLQEYPNITNWYYAEFDVSTNALLCWIIDPFVMKLKNPAITVTAVKSGQVLKQINFSPDIAKDESFKTVKTGKLLTVISESQKKSAYLNNCIEVICNNPIVKLTDSLFTCIKVKDSLQINTISKIEINPKSKRRILIYYTAQAGESYQLVINKNAITDVYSNINKQSMHTFKTQTSQAVPKNISIPYTSYINPLNGRELIVKANWTADKSYEILLQKNSCIDIYGSKIDSSGIKLQCPKTENYGSLQVVVTSQKNYIYQLINKDPKKNSAVQLTPILKQGSILFVNVAPGDYILRAIEDSNANKKWDTGNFEKSEFPEKIILFDKPIQIKANWENVIEWKISN